MDKWFFIDMETLGLSSDSKVISIGLLCTDDTMKHYSEDMLYQKGIYIKLDINEQKNRTVDAHTLNYWKEELSDKNINTFLKSGKSWNLDKAYSFIEKYVQINNINYETDVIWSRGLFDKFLWQSLFPKSELFPHYIWRDTQTALDVLIGNINGNISSKYIKRKHDALYNCVFEYKRLKKTLEIYE